MASIKQSIDKLSSLRGTLYTKLSGNGVKGISATSTFNALISKLSEGVPDQNQKRWRQILGSTKTTTRASSNTVISIPGLKAKVPTIIWFYGKIYVNNSPSKEISNRDGVRDDIGSFSGSNSFSYSGSFGFTLTAENGQFRFRPYASGYNYSDDECEGPISVSFSSAEITIDRVEQFY